jgi:serine O-acetyltransferase
VVIGETAVVGRNCSFLHGVTLGSTGKDQGARHPQIGDDVLIGCSAIVLGNITIGRWFYNICISLYVCMHVYL